MKKLVSFALLISLSLMLVVPVAALAKGGPPEGKGPGFTPPGQTKKAAATAGAAASAAESEAEEPAEESAPAGKAAKKAEKQEAKPEKAAEKAEKAAVKAAVKAEQKGSHEAPVAAMVAASEESETPAPDAEEPAEPAKLTGIANALSRIMANIERAEARVAAGEKSAVPPGLLKVLAKFMGWLGIDAEPDPEPGVTDPTEGSEEETGTPVPGEGSEEETGTLLPDEGSEEGTPTITPEITE
jgi:hypothetical protein